MIRENRNYPWKHDLVGNWHCRMPRGNTPGPTEFRVGCGCYSFGTMAAPDARSHTGRRAFLAGVAALAGSGRQTRAETATRKFYTAFVPGSLGVKVGQAEAIELAARHGFDSVQPFPRDLETDGVQKHVEALEGKGLRWAAAGLPVEFRKGEAEFEESMSSLPGVVAVLQQAGVDRVGTWLSPAHATLTYLENFKTTAERLGKAAGILQDHGMRLGLEYVGTKRNWTASRHPFVHTMSETRELIAAIDRPNVGFVLDSWHWWTSYETGEDIRSLAGEDVVSADLNDAPSGVPRDEQFDGKRELPLATGVINVREFLEALVAIGFNGPVRAEPFNSQLNELEDNEASRISGDALRRAFALVG